MKEIFKTQKRVILSIVILLLGVIFIVSSYAWFSVNLNVKIKEFNMVVSKNGGLTISFDAINFDTAIELNRDTIINNLKETYPNHINQWAATGLTPVSTNGISRDNTYFFDIYATSGVKYRTRQKDNGYINATKVVDDQPRAFNKYIAFDVFFKNVNGSPVADNLYFAEDTAITMVSESSEEMVGLVNSLRIGIVKVGTLPTGTDPTLIQNLQCQGRCQSIIYEPNSQMHTDLSIERAMKYNINLMNGRRFPTYGMIKAGGPIYVKDNISGSPTLDLNYFALQNTITEQDFETPLFEIPDGITKARIYLWIEGQDIDSLETDSEGADLFVDLNFIKDTKSYEQYD